MQVTENHERKWAMTKLDRGDYLLPSNGKQRLYRIKFVAGEGWPLWQWPEMIREESVLDINVDDWSMWECFGSAMETRQEAINDAIRIGDGRG